jgi:hypothetical protein
MRITVLKNESDNKSPRAQTFVYRLSQIRTANSTGNRNTVIVIQYTSGQKRRRVYVLTVHIDNNIIIRGVKS